MSHIQGGVVIGESHKGVWSLVSHIQGGVVIGESHTRRRGHW